MTELKITGVRRLGEVLGISKTAAAEIAKEPWFPKKGPDGSWATGDVQKAYAAHKSGGALAPEKPPTSAAVESAGEDTEQLRKILETSRDPEVIAEVTVALVARSIARADLSVKHVIAMKSALEELRKGASGYLEIAKKRGELIERDVAKVVLGQLARRAIAVLERYEVQLAQQVEAWVSDGAFLAKGSEERARVVRAWAIGYTHECRKVEANTIEDLVAAEVKEQAS